MRDAILVEKIIELMSITRVTAGQNTHARKFTIATKPAPSHDQRIDDRLAHGGKLPPRAPKVGRRDEEDLRPFPRDPGRTQERCAPGHPTFPPEIKLPPRCQGV